MSTQLSEKIRESVTYLKGSSADIGVVLGSGFAKFGDYAFDKSIVYDLKNIPHMHGPKVQGHGGKLIFAELFGKRICVMTGRIHMYEGYKASEVVYPVRVMQALGVKNLVLTNASGSLRLGIKPGSVLVLNDHINFTGQNCLAETPLEFGPQFVDMVGAYDKDWRQKILKSSAELQEGIYIGALGPTFETPAETRMFAGLGGDVIGMSTVQETIAARQLKMKVAGLSFATNYCGGLAANVNHEEVLAMGKNRADYLQSILLETIKVAP